MSEREKELREGKVYVGGTTAEEVLEHEGMEKV